MSDPGNRVTGLLLNPRLPESRRLKIEAAWKTKLTAIESSAGADAIGILTSGSTSTGSVESVTVLSRSALEASAVAVNRHFHFNSKTRWALMLPMFHVGGYMIPLRAALIGAEVFPLKSEWNAETATAFLADKKVSVVSLVPAQVFDLVSSQLRAPSSLQTVIVGGGRLDSGLRQQALALGWPVFESYGMTETCSQIAASESAQSSRMKSLGHFQLRVDPETNELLVKGPALFSGKLQIDGENVVWQPAETEGEGFYRTTDRVQLFTENSAIYLSFLGRTIDVVKVLGENVDLAKVRAVLGSIDLPSGVTSMEIVAIANQRREHELVLVLEVPEVEFDADHVLKVLRKVQSRLRESLLPVEVPTAIRSVARFPRSELGKTLYQKLLAELS
jgi:O-succinylbenzoic acid--CoA ligase